MMWRSIDLCCPHVSGVGGICSRWRHVPPTSQGDQKPFYSISDHNCAGSNVVGGICPGAHAQTRIGSVKDRRLCGLIFPPTSILLNKRLSLIYSIALIRTEILI